MPTAEAEEQVNSIVFNETLVTLLGLESGAPAEYWQYAADIRWYGVHQQTAWKGIQPSQEHIPRMELNIQ